MNPVKYELDEKKQNYYNIHQHLAYELRNVKASKQTQETDIYSLRVIYGSIAYKLNARTKYPNDQYESISETKRCRCNEQAENHDTFRVSCHSAVHVIQIIASGILLYFVQVCIFFVLYLSTQRGLLLCFRVIKEWYIKENSFGSCKW